jgi:outer membrane protein assembly factor BamB
LRTSRTLLALGALVLLTGCWTVPGAGPQRSGHNPAELALTPGNVASLEPDWTWQAEWTTPRAVQDPIVTPDGVHVSVGHKLVTVDPDTGGERWRAVLYDAGTAAQIPIAATKPAYEGGQVLVSVSVYRNFVPGSGTRSYDGATGANLGDVARSAIEVPVPRDRRVAATFGDVVGTGLGAVGYFVTDRDDASRSWSALLATYGLEGSERLAGPAVATDRFFFAYGDTLFAYPLDRPAGCTPLIEGSTLVVCPPLWSQRFGDGLTAPVLSNDGSTLVVADAGHVYALDPATGSQHWNGNLPSADEPGARASIDDDQVFVTNGGTLSAFTRDGCPGFDACSPGWTADTAGPVTAQAAVAGGVVYTATTSGNLRAFRASGCGGFICGPRWQHDLGVDLSGAPAVSNGRLFVGTVDGRLVSFRPSGDGSVRGTMTGAGSSTLGDAAGRPFLRSTSSGTFDATTLGAGTYNFEVSDLGTQRYLKLDLVTGEGTLEASAGPFVSGVSDVELTVGGGTGRFEGSAGTLVLDDYARTDVTCLPDFPPGLFCDWNETATLTGSVLLP